MDKDLRNYSTEELLKLKSKAESEVAMYKNIQLAKKTQINSVYGAMGSPYFRYYDLRMAEGITTSGQLAIRWVSQDVNKALNKVLNTNDIDYVVYNDTDSVVGDSMVYVNGTHQTIASLYEQGNTFAKNDELRQNFVKLVENATTLSVNPKSGLVEEKLIKYVMKHKVKKRMYRITAPDGKSVVVTQDHSVMVVRDGSIISVSPPNMLETDKIVNYPTEQTNFVVEDLGIQEIDVYDIEVEDNHNFFANDICVHNSAYFVLEEVVNRSKYKNANKEEIVKFLDKFCEEVLQKLINKSYENLKDYVNAFEQRLIMKREVIADVSVFVAKKRYALSVYNSEGVQYKEPKIKVTGLELVRSSTPRVVRDVLKKGVKEVLYKDEAAVQEFIANFKSTYMTYSVEEIAFPRGVNGVSKYSSNGPTVYKQKTPIHVRAALLFNSQVEKYKLTHLHQPIKDGNKIKFVYLKLPNTLHEDVIGFVDTLPKEFKLDTYVDKERMFETSFVNAMKSLMDPLGWSTEPKASLDSFFF